MAVNLFFFSVATRFPLSTVIIDRNTCKQPIVQIRGGRAHSLLSRMILVR